MKTNKYMKINNIHVLQTIFYALTFSFSILKVNTRYS